MLYSIPIVIIILWLIDRSITPYSIRAIRGYKKSRIYGLAIFIIVAFSCLKDPFVYPDNIAYYYGFIYDWEGEETVNFGYLFLNNFIKFFWKNFYLFSAIVAIMINIAYGKFIKDYSPHIWLSLLLFVFINYYPAFFLLRQYLAMPFVFMAVKYTIERNHKMFLLSLVLAYSFHTTSLVIFPLYYLYNLSYSKRNSLFLIVMTCIGSASLVTLGTLLSKYFPMYAHYLDIDAGEAAWSRAIMKIYICLIYIYTLRKKCFDNNINKVVFISMIMCVIICVGAATIYGVYRLRDYYALADFIGIPIILKEASKMRGLKRTAIKFMTLIYIILLAYSFNSFVTSANMMNDYQMFWEGVPRERESVV